MDCKPPAVEPREWIANRNLPPLGRCRSLVPPQWPDGGNGLMAPRKGLAPYRAFGSAAPCGYRGKFSAGVKGLHSAGRERRTQRIGLLPPRRKHERRRAYSRSGVWR